MTAVVVVADSGPQHAALTEAVGAVAGASIVRHVSGRTALDRALATIEPDLVVIGDLRAPAHAMARLAEARRAAPRAKIVVAGSGPGATWLADALRAGAAAVVPGPVEPRTLAIVLREVSAAEPPARRPAPLHAAGLPDLIPPHGAGEPGASICVAA